MDELELHDAQRILRRAVRLDLAQPLPPVLDVESLTVAAAELGVGPTALAMALAEARAGALATEPTGRLDRLIGPRQVTVVRHCRVRPVDVERLAGEWFERRHVLRVMRASDGIVVARRRSDAVASASRAVRSLHGGGGLSHVREVRGAVGALPDGTAAVCVHADLADRRVVALAVGGGVSVVALAGIGLGTVVLSPFVAAAAPIAALAGIVVARRAHAKEVADVEQALEQVADALSDGAPPPAPLTALSRGLRRLVGR